MNLDRARALAQHVVAQMGVTPQIHRFVSPDDQHEVNVALAANWPRYGMKTALTVDLITTPLGLRPSEFELLAVASSRWDAIEQLVANAGLKYRVGDIPWAPGAVYHDAVAAAYPGLAVRHLLAVDPLDPALALVGPRDMQPAVRWLQLVPITDKELREVEQRGLAILLARIETSGADLSDLGRESVV